MASPTAAQRVYYRLEKELPFPEVEPAVPIRVVEVRDLPIKGLIRRIRLVDPVVTSTARFTLSESQLVGAIPVGGNLDIITVHPTSMGTTPQDLIADGLANAEGDLAAGSEGIPFQLTPYETDYRLGSMWIGYAPTEFTETLVIQLTIEALFP